MIKKIELFVELFRSDVLAFYVFSLVLILLPKGTKIVNSAEGLAGFPPTVAPIIFLSRLVFPFLFGFHGW